ncbi:MAG: energy transducer TonB, partial [Pseudomonadota bacterium]
LAEPAMVDTHADDASVETVDTDPEAVAAEAPQVVPAEASAPQPQEIEVAAVDPVEEVTADAPVPATVEATDPAAEDAVTAPLPQARPRNIPPPVETRRTARRAEPQPTRQQRQRQNTTAPEAEDTPEREAPTRKATRGGGASAAENADTRGSGNSGASGNASSAGQGQRATAGGDPGAKRDYMSRLAAILTRHKRYPRRAQSRRQEGVGHLFFVVEASGSVATIRLTKSTGHRLLDEEILAILGRVGRLPPIPDDVGVARLEIVVPVNFNLR